MSSTLTPRPYATARLIREHELQPLQLALAATDADYNECPRLGDPTAPSTRLLRLIADSTPDEVMSTMYAVARMRGGTPELVDVGLGGDDFGGYAA